MGIIITILIILVAGFMFMFVMGAKNSNPKCPRCKKPMEIIDMTENSDIYRCKSCGYIEEL